jgi:hypothetical protein
MASDQECDLGEPFRPPPLEYWQEQSQGGSSDRGSTACTRTSSMHILTFSWLNDLTIK